MGSRNGMRVDLFGVDMVCTCPGTPTQYEGTVDGNPAYFRYRFGTVSFTITAVGTDPVLPREKDVLYQYSETDEREVAMFWGDMPHEEVVAFMTLHVARFRNRRTDRP